MQAGISTASFFPVYTEQTLPLIASYGASVCEVFFEADAEYDPDFIDQLREIAQQNRLEITSVHAFCASFEPFLFSNYERRRQDALNTFLRAVQAAKRAGAKYYTFHGDYRAAELDAVDFPHYARCFEEILSIAEAHGVSIAWENVSWCQSSRPEFITRMQQYISPSRFHYTLDLKQCRRANLPADAYLNVMGENLVNVHINDFDQTSDCLLPGTGQEDFPALLEKLRALGYRGNLIIEVYRKNFDKHEDVHKSLQFVKSLLA